MSEPKGIQTFFSVLSTTGCMREPEIMCGCVVNKNFLGIPCEIPFDTKIQHCITVKTQRHVWVKHVDPTMGFNNIDV